MIAKNESGVKKAFFVKQISIADSARARFSSRRPQGCVRADSVARNLHSGSAYGAGTGSLVEVGRR
jgi:hypothetical protein